MKNSMKTRTLALFPCIAFSGALMAQGKLVDRRDQAEGWYLPIECELTANGGKTDGVSVTIYKDNTMVSQLNPKEVGATCKLELDIDNQFTVKFAKEGYREKLVYVDTHLPEGQVEYKKYTCNVNMEPMDKFTHSDPFYLDFPSSIVRWNGDQAAFTHNDEYLSGIQLKMALLGAQLE
jgi:hypothetical protein